MQGKNRYTQATAGWRPEAGGTATTTATDGHRGTENTENDLKKNRTPKLNGDDNHLGVAPGGVPHLRSEISDFRLRSSNGHDSDNSHDNSSLTQSRKERKEQHCFLGRPLGSLSAFVYVHLRQAAQFS
jgi:hypothetical protein